jgi:hypothetical protein
MNESDIPALRPMMVLIAGMSASVAFAQTTTTAPQAASPYTLRVFAQAPSGLSAPDSIAVVHDHVCRTRTQVRTS